MPTPALLVQAAPPPSPYCCCSPRCSSLGSFGEAGLFTCILSSWRLRVLAWAARHPSVGPSSGGLPLLDTTGASGFGLLFRGTPHSLEMSDAFSLPSRSFRAPAARADPWLRHGLRRHPSTLGALLARCPAVDCPPTLRIPPLVRPSRYSGPSLIGSYLRAVALPLAGDAVPWRRGITPTLPNPFAPGSFPLPTGCYSPWVIIHFAHCT